MKKPKKIKNKNNNKKKNIENKDDEVESVDFVQIFNRQIYTVQKVPDLCFSYHIHIIQLVRI